MHDRIKVYLAGPITNCNPDQKVMWRKRMKVALRNAGFQPLDPTEEKARKGALAVSADIEEADVVIANMWRESVGTVLGIVQAQRLGIPVILIDQHHLNSPILQSLADETVRTESAAVNLLKDKIESSLRPTLTVTKKLKSGKFASDTFNVRKLQRSLKSSCTLAGIDDAVFCTLLLRRVRRAIIEGATNGTILSNEIKRLIFSELDRLASEDATFSDQDSKKMQASAATMREHWEEYDAFMKEAQQKEADLIALYEQELDELSAQLSRALLLLQKDRISLPTENEENDRVALRLSANLQTILSGKRALCVRRIGMPSFKNAFGRLGLRGEDFERFFDEREVDGRQSNLNTNLKGWIDSFSFVLYSGRDLRHISDQKVKDAPNFIRGFGPNDAIKRLLYDGSTRA